MIVTLNLFGSQCLQIAFLLILLLKLKNDTVISTLIAIRILILIPICNDTVFVIIISIGQSGALQWWNRGGLSEVQCFGNR